MVGKVGQAKSLMMPSGAVEIEGRVIDALSEGLPIEAGSRVKVVEVRGSRVVVRPTTEATSHRSDDPLSQPIESIGVDPFDDPASDAHGRGRCLTTRPSRGRFSKRSASTDTAAMAHGRARSNQEYDRNGGRRNQADLHHRALRGDHLRFDLSWRSSPATSGSGFSRSRPAPASASSI